MLYNIEEFLRIPRVLRAHVGEQGIGFLVRGTVTVLAHRACQVHYLLLRVHAYLEITCRNFNTVLGSASNRGESF